ncbi:MAG: helix-turn-helix domain-containing protein [Spirochaetia bacterium]|jgi:hypothetical protein
MLSIIRVEHNRDRPYLMVSKATLRDHSLSWASRGFLCFLLAKPDDWQLRVDALARECKRCEKTVYRWLKPLIVAGYVTRTEIKHRKEDGRFEEGCLYVVYEDKSLRPRDREDDVRLDGLVVPF